MRIADTIGFFAAVLLIWTVVSYYVPIRREIIEPIEFPWVTFMMVCVIYVATYAIIKFVPMMRDGVSYADVKTVLMAIGVVVLPTWLSLLGTIITLQVTNSESKESLKMSRNLFWGLGLILALVTGTATYIA